MRGSSSAEMTMGFKKGFLSAPEPPRKPSRRKQNALPDEAYLPAETYEFADAETGGIAADDPQLASISSSEEAYAYSVDFCRSHCNQYNQDALRLDPSVNVQFASDLRAVHFNRRLFGHHMGQGHAGEKRTMLLPSGIVLQYLEWGNEQAPPIVMLHDVCDSKHIWDDVAQPLADKYRVLSLDFRGHGESSRSPRHDYSIERLVEDLHELVVRLSLNGREWGGKFTRPWVLCGKGMGGAVATAYAARHEGRVAGVVLWDYEPEMPKERICFNPYQTAHFRDPEAVAALLARQLGLEDDAKYLAIHFVNKAEMVDEDDYKAGARFRMDPHFYLADINPGLAWTQLHAVAKSCRVLVVHTQESRDWSYERASRVVSILEEGAGDGTATGALSVRLAVASRGTKREEVTQGMSHIVEDLELLYKVRPRRVLSSRVQELCVCTAGFDSLVSKTLRHLSHPHRALRITCSALRTRSTGLLGRSSRRRVRSIIRPSQRKSSTPKRRIERPTARPRVSWPGSCGKTTSLFPHSTLTICEQDHIQFEFPISNLNLKYGITPTA